MRRRHATALAAIGLGLLLAGAAQAREMGMGELEFRNSCAQCHGLSGKGDGPVAQYLTPPPADLTTLQKDNGGVFPVSRVYAVIDGTGAEGAHGERAMPIWGDRYAAGMSQEVDPQGVTGPFTSEEIQALVRTRILSLVEYISTLQSKCCRSDPAPAPAGLGGDVVFGVGRCRRRLAVALPDVSNNAVGTRRVRQLAPENPQSGCSLGRAANP
jgi:mono/diheme cytochrome c family protein